MEYYSEDELGTVRAFFTNFKRRARAPPGCVHWAAAVLRWTGGLRVWEGSRVFL